MYSTVQSYYLWLHYRSQKKETSIDMNLQMKPNWLRTGVQAQIEPPRIPLIKAKEKE